jgi:hypothetical protein
MCESMHLELCADKDACSCACHTWSTGNPKKFEGQKILDAILDANVCEHGIHAPHKVGYGSTWCPGVAEKLGPMNPKEMQQVEDGVVARYFPHLANETIAELADHLVRVVMDSFNRRRVVRGDGEVIHWPKPTRCHSCDALLVCGLCPNKLCPMKR